MPCGEQRLSRLSFSVIRSVPIMPLTFALTRLLCREASTSYTSLAWMPFCRARRRIGSRIRASSSGVYLLNMGARNTGKISMINAWKAIVTPAPHRCQVLGRRRTIPNSAITSRPPSTMLIPSIFAWSPNQPPKL